MSYGLREGDPLSARVEVEAESVARAAAPRAGFTS